VGNAERERHRRENLYYNYRKSGHQVREYKGTPQRLHIMDNNQASIVGKKANTTMKTLGTVKTEAEHRERPDRAPREEIALKNKAPEATIKKEEDTLEVKS
jgi:hypothetical protein